MAFTTLREKGFYDDTESIGKSLAAARALYDYYRKGGVRERTQNKEEAINKGLDLRNAADESVLDLIRPEAKQKLKGLELGNRSKELSNQGTEITNTYLPRSEAARIGATEAGTEGTRIKNRLTAEDAARADQDRAALVARNNSVLVGTPFEYLLKLGNPEIATKATMDTRTLADTAAGVNTVYTTEVAEPGAPLPTDLTQLSDRVASLRAMLDEEQDPTIKARLQARIDKLSAQAAQTQDPARQRVPGMLVSANGRSLAETKDDKPSSTLLKEAAAMGITVPMGATNESLANLISTKVKETTIGLEGGLQLEGDMAVVGKYLQPKDPELKKLEYAEMRELRKNVHSSSGTVASLEQLKVAIKDLNTGRLIGSDPIVVLRRLLPGAENLEQAVAIINQMTPGARNGMPGAASDRDVAMFKASLPSLLNSPEGNAKIIEYLIKLKTRDQDALNFINKARSEGASLESASALWNDYVSNVSLFSDEDPVDIYTYVAEKENQTESSTEPNAGYQAAPTQTQPTTQKRSFNVTDPQTGNTRVVTNPTPDQIKAAQERGWVINPAN